MNPLLATGAVKIFGVRVPQDHDRRDGPTTVGRYLCEEIVLPFFYTEDRDQAERILLAAAHALVDDAGARAALTEMRGRYAMVGAALEPAVQWRITDNWLELSLWFLVPPRGVRDIEDAMSRDIPAGLHAAGIGIGS